MSRREILALSAYIVLAVLMIWSRIAGINESLWHDEIFTVQQYIVPGPPAIFGHYGTNDHILFSVLGWLTVHLPGFGDGAYRLWSIVPFIAAVAILTGWLHKRAGVSVALLFAFLATASAGLLDLSTGARGYGLAFFAMALMTIASYEAAARETSGWLSLFAVAGVLGCWTLPTFVLSFAGISGALLIRRLPRRMLLIRLAAATVAVGGWYALPASALIHSTGQQFGARLTWYAPVTGAATELMSAFVPAISWTGSDLLWSLLAAAPVLVIGLFVARREMRHINAVAVVPVTLTFLVLTLGRFYVDPRFVSYLLVPIFVFAAFGLKALLKPRSRRSWIVTAWLYGTMLTFIAALFVLAATTHSRIPLEANREAADAAAAALDTARRPIILDTHSPADILYYLPKHVMVLKPSRSRLERFICSRRLKKTGLLFIRQPYGVHTVDTSCLVRRGARLRVFRQRSRGFKILFWDVPPEVLK